MAERESLVGVVLGSYRIRSWPKPKKDRDQLHDDLLQLLKNYFNKSQLHSVGFSFLDGAPLLWVGALDELGAQKVTFTLVLSQRIALDHQPRIKDRLTSDLGAVGVALVFIAVLPGDLADAADFNRFEVEDVRAEYDSLLDAVKNAGSEGLEFFKVFVMQPKTNPQIQEALIHTMLSKELMRVIDGRLSI